MYFTYTCIALLILLAKAIHPCEVDVVPVAISTIPWHASALGSISTMGRHGIFGAKGWLSTLGTVYPS